MESLGDAVLSENLHEKQVLHEVAVLIAQSTDHGHRGHLCIKHADGVVGWAKRLEPLHSRINCGGNGLERVLGRLANGKEVVQRIEAVGRRLVGV